MNANKKMKVAAAFGAFLASTITAQAADLPRTTVAPAPVVVVDDYEPFFVKLGVTFADNQTRTRLYSQNPSLYRNGLTGVYPVGVVSTLSDVTTLGFGFGYYFTRNWSVNVSSGIPLSAKVNTRGYNPLNPSLPAGTTLNKILPAVVPITVAYHFTNFGAFQPYVGVGVAPAFTFSVTDAFIKNTKASGSFGPAFQAGFDYMFTRNLGFTFDVIKTFNYGTAHGTGIAPAPGVPVVTRQNVHFMPWLFSVGLTYRFGASTPAVVAKY